MEHGLGETEMSNQEQVSEYVFYNRPRPNYREPTTEDLEDASRVGRRAIADFERENAYRLPWVHSVSSLPYQPNIARDHGKGDITDW